MKKGIIIKGVGGLYEVMTGERDKESNGGCNIINCRARGVFRHEGITPLPGDRVRVNIADKDAHTDEYVIDEIDERDNFLIRPAVANLTHLFLVLPSAQPKPDLFCGDKLISAAEIRNIESVIIITKSDIDSKNAENIKAVYEKSGFIVFLTDKNGSGDKDIFDYISNESKKKTVCAAFAGVSGAGKSTLMTRLFPDLKLKTGEISSKIKRGKNTTRHAELYPVKTDENISYIADTPGFSMIDFANYNFVEEENLPRSFREFNDVLGQCKYTKCTHIKEEGCAVIEKMREGYISESRHHSYVEMLFEIRKNPPWKRKHSIK